MEKIKQLHEEAQRLSRHFRDAERGLIDVLQKIDDCRGFREPGYSSLFQYSTRALGLSEAVTCTLISLARKSREIPALKKKIESGEVSVSNARIIAPVLTPENQEDLIGKASALAKRDLERTVAAEFPARAVPESSRYVAPERIELKLGISPELRDKFKRVQDLVSRSTREAATMEQALEAMAEEYLRRNDPVLKAERRSPKPSSTEPAPGQVIRAGNLNSRRKPIPAPVQHTVNLRDQGRCVEILPHGERCAEKRWVDLHHLVEVARGGSHEPENLITLCAAHHRMRHAKARVAPHGSKRFLPLSELPLFE